MNDRAGRILLPALTLVALLAIWDAAIRFSWIESYLLPSPTAVLSALWSGYVTDGVLWPHFLTTASETVVGFVLGCAVALILGSLVAEFKPLEQMVYPYVVAMQSMPKVALAPLLIVWFGFGFLSKVVLVALICFFPMFVNVMAGLRSAPTELLDLYTAFSAGRFQIFKDIKLPSALPSIFAGLQISLVLSLLGAVVGEFVASNKGLGSLIQAASLTFDLPIMFACILTLALMGATGNILMRWLQRRMLFWSEATQTNSSPGSTGKRSK